MKSVLETMRAQPAKVKCVEGRTFPQLPIGRKIFWENMIGISICIAIVLMLIDVLRDMTITEFSQTTNSEVRFWAMRGLLSMVTILPLGICIYLIGRVYTRLRPYHRCFYLDTASNLHQYDPRSVPIPFHGWRCACEIVSPDKTSPVEREETTVILEIRFCGLWSRRALLQNAPRSRWRVRISRSWHLRLIDTSREPGFELRLPLFGKDKVEGLDTYSLIAALKLLQEESYDLRTISEKGLEAFQSEEPRYAGKVG